jgi:hypothetical protein
LQLCAAGGRAVARARGGCGVAPRDAGAVLVH